MVRLAWHDAGTFDKDVEGEWPKAGGATGRWLLVNQSINRWWYALHYGFTQTYNWIFFSFSCLLSNYLPNTSNIISLKKASIRFEPEILHGANAGLVNAHNLLVPIKEQFPVISYADLYQMASARAIETASGPSLGIRYGRVDVESGKDCSPEGNLPDGEAGPDGNYGGDVGTASTKSKKPQGHLRKVFYRMGLDDEAIVALSGAHTLGRAYKDRSGLGKESTKFTDGSSTQKFANGEDAPYTPGGSSWTPEFFVFDNSYFKIIDDESVDEELLKMSTDRAVFVDEDFRPFAETFRDDQDSFFESYAKAHRQLSELGAKFYPEPIELD